MNYDMQDFREDIIDQSHKIPVLVDFWAEWCGPCKMLGPILEKLAEKNKDKFALVKLNTDENQELADQYGIRGIPNVKLFINGEVADEFTGALPENMVEQWLMKAIPSKYKEKIEEARIEFSQNKFDNAKLKLEKVLKAEPGNEEAKLLLGNILVFENPNEAIKLVENIDGSTGNYQQVEAIQTLADLLQKGDRTDSLHEADVKELYSSALSELKKRNFDSALGKFIEVIRIDRMYDDDGARKACIAIFKYLGEENEITIRHRRDFGSALYV
jgi:putative thioredoxin